MGSFHPSAVFMAWISAPMGFPEPSKGAALTMVAPSILRRVTSPVTGSISEGELPWFVSLVRVSFHFWPVLATRDPVVSSILSDRASGLSSMEASTIVAKLLVISAPYFQQRRFFWKSRHHGVKMTTCLPGADLGERER